MSLDAINSATATLGLRWAVSKTRPGFNPIENNQDVNDRVVFGPGTGIDQINELVASVVTVTAGATSDIDLSAALTNVVNDPNVALARVRLLSVKLLGTADTDAAGAVLGTACTGVVVGGALAAAWLGPFVDTTDRISLGNGDVLFVTRRGATGMVVTSGSADVLRVVNSDGAVAAKVRLSLWGAAS